MMLHPAPAVRLPTARRPSGRGRGSRSASRRSSSRASVTTIAGGSRLERVLDRVRGGLADGEQHVAGVGAVEALRAPASGAAARAAAPSDVALGGQADDERLAGGLAARERQHRDVVGPRAAGHRRHEPRGERRRVARAVRGGRREPPQAGVDRLAAPLHEPVGVEHERAAGGDRVLGLAVGDLARGADRRRQAGRRASAVAPSGPTISGGGWPALA